MRTVAPGRQVLESALSRCPHRSDAIHAIIVYFPVPRPEERARIWRQGFSPVAQFHNDVDLDAIAGEFPLTGGAIMNAIRGASLRVLKEGGRPIGRADVVAAIRREMVKEGRPG